MLAKNFADLIQRRGKSLGINAAFFGHVITPLFFVPIPVPPASPLLEMQGISPRWEHEVELGLFF